MVLPQLNFWPFKRKPRPPPPLHRALQRLSSSNEEQKLDDEGDERLYKSKSRIFSNIRLFDNQQQYGLEELATKRRVRKKDSMERNALHIACMNRPDVETIMLLVDVYPDGINEIDKVGRLPFHTACANHAPVEVMEYLWRLNPDSVFELTDRGTTPLYCALESKASLDVVEFLVEKDPEALTVDSYKLGKTPVHTAVCCGQSLEVIRFLLRKRPQALGEEDAWGKTPLACAAASSHHYQSSEDFAEVLDFLVDPVRIIQPDRAGLLPLHIACLNRNRLEDIEMLFDEFPDAICQPDNMGRLPLHSACINPHVQLELLEFLVEGHPEALKTFDKNGSVPLHLAIQRKVPVECVLFLISQAEGAVRTREASSMMYPLHMACKMGSDFEILEALIDIFPKAIDIPDKKGNTIFHTACMCSKLDFEFAQLLLQQCGHDTVRTTNEDGSLPLHLAVQHRAPWPVLELLIDHYPQALDIKDAKGDVPLHKAFQTVTKMHVLVRLAQLNHHALNRINVKGLKPLDCASVLVEKRFKRARMWYNIRKAYCPYCIRNRFHD